MGATYQPHRANTEITRILDFIQAATVGVGAYRMVAREGRVLTIRLDDAVGVARFFEITVAEPL